MDDRGPVAPGPPRPAWSFSPLPALEALTGDLAPRPFLDTSVAWRLHFGEVPEASLGPYGGPKGARAQAELAALHSVLHSAGDAILLGFQHQARCPAGSPSSTVELRFRSTPQAMQARQDWARDGEVVVHAAASPHSQAAQTPGTPPFWSAACPSPLPVRALLPRSWLLRATLRVTWLWLTSSLGTPAKERPRKATTAPWWPWSCRPPRTQPWLACRPTSTAYPGCASTSALPPAASLCRPRLAPRALPRPAGRTQPPARPRGTTGDRLAHAREPTGGLTAAPLRAPAHSSRGAPRACAQTFTSSWMLSMPAAHGIAAGWATADPRQTHRAPP